MDNLDEKIRSALSTNDAKDLGDPNDGLRLDRMVLSTLRESNRFTTVVAFVFTFVMLGVAVFCAIRFFAGEGTKELIGWAAGFLVCMIAVSMVKLWFWMEMQRVAVTREVKRVELLVAHD